MSKWVMRAHFKHIRSKIFSMIQGTPQFNGFWPLQSLFEDLGIHQDSNSQKGSSLGSENVHSFTLSTSGSMKCDSRSSLLVHTLASFFLSREPKAKVATVNKLKPPFWILVFIFLMIQLRFMKFKPPSLLNLCILVVFSINATCIVQCYIAKF
jgi:hypothetical protein